MTQFIVFSARRVPRLPDELSIVPVAEAQAYVRQYVEQHRFLAQQPVWTLANIGREVIHDLCDEAARNLADGVPFERSTLARLLRSLCDSCDEIMLWYTSDEGPIDTTHSQEDFLDSIELQLKQFPPEVWARFSRSPPRGSSGGERG